MDNPGKTFLLIDDVINAPFYNGLIPFGSVTDAKLWLNRQIANFVDAEIRVYNAAGNITETHEHVCDFKGWWAVLMVAPAEGAPKFVLITRVHRFLARKEKGETKL